MKIRTLLIAFMCTGVATGVFVVAVPRRSVGSVDRTTAAGRGPEPVRERPEHVRYWLLFSRVASLKEKADELERKGRKTALRTAVKKDAGLSDEQGQVLENISLECAGEVARLDARAKQIIDTFKSRFPGGRVPDGETLPPPPPELISLQRERDDAVLRARDRLHASIGDREFERLDAFARRYGRDTQITSPEK